jgi:hypothetical protein
LTFWRFFRRDGPIRRLEDLRGADYAIYNINSLGERLITARGIGARFVVTESPSAALRLVEDGKCAGTFASQLTALSIMERDGLKRLVRLNESIEGFDVRHALAVHRGDAQLLARLNEGLAILRQSGEFDRIQHKWFGRFGGTLFTWEQLVNYVAVALALGELLQCLCLFGQFLFLGLIRLSLSFAGFRFATAGLATFRLPGTALRLARCCFSAFGFTCAALWFALTAFGFPFAAFRLARRCITALRFTFATFRLTGGRFSCGRLRRGLSGLFRGRFKRVLGFFRGLLGILRLGLGNLCLGVFRGLGGLGEGVGQVVLLLARLLELRGGFLGDLLLLLGQCLL